MLFRTKYSHFVQYLFPELTIFLTGSKSLMDRRLRISVQITRMRAEM